MAFAIKTKGESINDGGRQLKIGTHTYTIVSIGTAINKKDPTGREQQIVMDLRNGTDYVCKVYLAVESKDSVVAEIAAKTIRAFAHAVGFDGVIKPETLSRLKDGVVSITAKETTSKDGTKKYVNSQTVEAVDGGDEEPDGGEEPEEEEEGEEEEETPEPEPAPAPAAAKKRPWGK